MIATVSSFLLIAFGMTFVSTYLSLISLGVSIGFFIGIGAQLPSIRDRLHKCWLQTGN